jgi:hypothetical protein
MDDVVALQHPRLLRRQAELGAAREQRLDPPEQRRVHADLVAVPGQDRREIALQRLQRIVGMGAGQGAEHVPDAVERAAAALQRADRVVEAGLRRLGGDRLDLRGVLGQRPVERRPEVLGPDPRERRHVERLVPGREERVVLLGGGRHVHGSVFLLASKELGHASPGGKEA